MTEQGFVRSFNSDLENGSKDLILIRLHVDRKHILYHRMDRKDILYQNGNNEVAPVDKEADDGNNINCEAEVTNENSKESSIRFLTALL